MSIYRRPELKLPASEEEILYAQEKIGARLPSPLRDLYGFRNGGWTEDLRHFPLEPGPEGGLRAGLTNGTEVYIEMGYRIPEEMRLFASDSGGELYGIWAPVSASPCFDHPFVHVAREVVREDGIR